MPPDEFTETLSWLNQRALFEHDDDDALEVSDERVASLLDRLAKLGDAERAEVLRDLTATQIDNLLVYAWRVGREPFKDEVEFDAAHAAQVHKLLAERLELLSQDHVDRVGSSEANALEELLRALDWMAEHNESSRPYSLSPPEMISFPEKWEERTAAFVALTFASPMEVREAVVKELAERQIHRLLGLYSENMIERTDFTSDCHLLVPAARAMALAVYGAPEDQDFTFFLHVLMRSAAREHGCDLESTLEAVARELPPETSDTSRSVPGMLRTYARQSQGNQGIVGWFRDRLGSGT